MYRQRKGARFEFHQQERQRVEESTSLLDKFPELKSLKADLVYCCPGDVLQSRRMKYEVNLDQARSIFLFACPNYDCIEGNFELTEKLASAVARRQVLVTGEIFCQGWHRKITMGTSRCQNSLRYKLTLVYGVEARQPVLVA